MYANADGHQAHLTTDAVEVLDRYILSKLRLMVEEVTDAMDVYDLYRSCALITAFVDALNNWYIRRSRDRFWSRVGTSQASDSAKLAAYDVLYTVLHTFCRTVAPLLPMLSESVYRGLTGERSVHLADWPDVSCLPADAALVAHMDTVREVCSAGHSIRKARGLRARLPLASVTVAGPGASALAPYLDLIADELNVKEVRLVEEVDDVADLVLQVNPSALGPRLGAATQHVIGAVRRGQWMRLPGGEVEVAGHVLAEGEYFLSLVPRDKDSSRALPGNDLVVSLSLEISEELELEGLARDLVRQVQEARKKAGLDVSDHIKLSLDFTHAPELRQAVGAHQEMVAGETLAGEIHFVHQPPPGAEEVALADGSAYYIGVERLKDY
jgi:isoleucyl-tRNA synthetase